MTGQASEHRTRVVIVGGGTAGWMTAAALVRRLPHACTVRLVESTEIGIVGVGEATLPHLRAFIEMLGIDEAEFMRTTQATYKLGIEFRDFGRIGERYLHPFGSFGTPLNGVPFHHYWLRMRAAGRQDSFFDYSIANVMAATKRFAPPSVDTGSILSSYAYAYQFDATLFAPYLRDYALARGAVRTEGKVVAVERDAASGDVAALALESGERIEGDLFVDCSGFRALLIGESLHSDWEDWSRWLPCDRAVAMPCASPTGGIEPLTRATAMGAGWRWRIPLRHRVGNGYVYSSAHIGDDEAAAALTAAVEGEPLADPRLLRFRAGRRTRSWHGNVVAIGLASGFLEPLESTSLYLAQGAIEQLVALFPIGGRVADADRDEFNEVVDWEYDRIRDFLILHYHATSRTDSAFWDHVRTMAVPDSLQEKIELFQVAGRLVRYTRGLFLEPSWLAVFLGQGIVPASWDQRAEAVGEGPLSAALDRLRGRIAEAVDRLPDHAGFLRGPAWGGAA
ncbi:tryptophan halogenase family protein [Sphingosinicella terrae]|uniref:tryptophan halogenase family protein n=1 Tax=Sphingosinicella terrae TaxID=2172047 RepID=UPI000E0D0B8B|nr:tryptophan halogenase family protein [Sphingosinicella terrae]